VYNTVEEVAQLADGVRAAKAFFGVDAPAGRPLGGGS
jgi:hypothetical protein